VTATSLSGANSPYFCIRKRTRNTRSPASSAKWVSAIGVFYDAVCPDVTLEDDLRRRDLTINCNGKRRLRAKSSIPMGVAVTWRRVYCVTCRTRSWRTRYAYCGVARFAARYADLGFRVAEDTLVLMERMTATGRSRCARHPERVWKEDGNARSASPGRCVLRDAAQCGALAKIFPELAAALWNSPAAALASGSRYRCACHVVVRYAAQIGAPNVVRFAALTHDLGKALSPPAKWPSHQWSRGKQASHSSSICVIA